MSETRTLAQFISRHRLCRPASSGSRSGQNRHPRRRGQRRRRIRPGTGRHHRNATCRTPEARPNPPWSAGATVPIRRPPPSPTVSSDTASTTKSRAFRPLTALRPACRPPWPWRNSITSPANGSSPPTPWAGKSRDACAPRRPRPPVPATTRPAWLAPWAAQRQPPRPWTWTPSRP